MHYIPWNEWIVLALFLVGAGGGAFLYAYVIWLKESKKVASSLQKALYIAPFITLAGLLILLVDLGRPERFLNAVFHFNPHSVLNMGVFIQGAFVNSALLIVGLLYLQKSSTKLFAYFMHATMVFAVLVCLYHGLLPVSMPRDGWSGALVFVMFFSSLLSGRAVIELITKSAHSSPALNLITLVGFWGVLGIWIYSLAIGTIGERAVLEFLFFQWNLSSIMLLGVSLSAIVATLLLTREFLNKAHPSAALILGGVAVEFFGAFMLKYGVILSGQLSFLVR